MFWLVTTSCRSCFNVNLFHLQTLAENITTNSSFAVPILKVRGIAKNNLIDNVTRSIKTIFGY